MDISKRLGGFVCFVEICHLIQDNVREQPLGSDGGTVVEGFSSKMVGILPECIPLAGGGPDLVLNA